MPCSLPGIFSSKDNFLKFVTKTIPIKKGSMHIATIPVPAETQEHTSKMQKRIAPSSFQKCTPELRTDCRAIKITKPSSSVPTTFATYSNLTTQSNTMDKDLRTIHIMECPKRYNIVLPFLKMRFKNGMIV
jgi:hypothetical protein